MNTLKIMRLLAVGTLLLSALVLSGCQSFRVTRDGSVDQREKTVAVPSGGGLQASLNKALLANGWKTYIYLPGEQPTGQKYLLVVETSGGGMDFDRWWSYDVSLVENPSRRQVIAMRGGAYEGTIVRRFIKELNQ
jgi:hypothetical protein